MFIKKATMLNMWLHIQLIYFIHTAIEMEDANSFLKKDNGIASFGKCLQFFE